MLNPRTDREALSRRALALTSVLMLGVLRVLVLALPPAIADSPLVTMVTSIGRLRNEEEPR